jgi:predicted DNA-binding protein (MmcQ/YjbR family)
VARTKTPTDTVLEQLRAFGLSYPGAHLKSPWPGHLDLAVKDKTFAYLSVPGEPFSIGCKLPHSSGLALALPFAQPTPYGLGKSGWVTADPPEDMAIPLELFKAWIDESYRALAPKKLVAQLDAGGGAKPAARKPAGKKTAAKKKAAKKPAARKSSAAKKKPAKRARR